MQLDRLEAERDNSLITGRVGKQPVLICSPHITVTKLQLQFYNRENNISNCQHLIAFTVGSMLNATSVLSYLTVKTSNDMGIIMNHEELSKLIKIMDFKIDVPLSHELVQTFLQKYIILKLNLSNQCFFKSPVPEGKSEGFKEFLYWNYKLQLYINIITFSLGHNLRKDGIIFKRRQQQARDMNWLTLETL